MPAHVPKKILLVSGFRLFPGSTGGHIHSGGIVRELARMGHRVMVYSLAGRRGDYHLRNSFRSAFRVDSIEHNLSEETNLGLCYGVLQTLARRLDYPRFWQHALMRRGLVPRRLKMALRDADIVLSDMPWCPRIPGPWFDKPWFLVSHNLEHQLLEQASPRQRRFAPWMRRIEQEAVHQYRDIFPCAEPDRDFFRANDVGGRLRLPIIRCGVDPDAYRVPPGTRENIRAELAVDADENLIVFSASRFAPNLEALAVLREFCRVQADFLSRERVRILVVGSVASEGFREGAMIVTGRVPEMAPYFAAGDAGLNPVVSGSGANVKLFEYLATRLPVISTQFGVRGTDLTPGVDFLLYGPHDLRETLMAFTRGRTREQWREFAEAVWSRHRGSCDKHTQVRAAVGQRPEF